MDYESIALFIKALQINTDEFLKLTEDEKIKYVKDRYFTYVRDENNLTNTEIMKLINSVYTEVRKNPNLILRYIPYMSQNGLSSEDTKRKYKETADKTKSEGKKEKEYVKTFYYKNIKNDIYDEIIVLLPLKSIYNCTTKVITLKNGDVISFFVNPYNYSQPLLLLSARGKPYMVRVSIHDNKWMLDDNKNLVTTIEMSLYDCMLGTVTAIEYVDGKLMKIEVPPETYTRLILDNNGWPIAPGKKSKLILNIKIKYPCNLSEYEREIIRTLRKIEQQKGS